MATDDKNNSLAEILRIIDSQEDIDNYVEVICQYFNEIKNNGKKHQKKHETKQ